WEELVKLKRRSISEARERLIEIMSDYKAYSGLRIIIVFDALYAKGMESKLAINNLEIIYTNEKETADDFIESLVASVKHVKIKSMLQRQTTQNKERFLVELLYAYMQENYLLILKVLMII